MMYILLVGFFIAYFITGLIRNILYIIDYFKRQEQDNKTRNRYNNYNRRLDG